MSNRLLLALQFWEQDKRQAMALARLITVLLDHESLLADLLLFSRYDSCVDNDVVIYAQRAFNQVHVASSKRRVTGWPIGPNGMALDLFKLVNDKHASKEWDYSGVLMMEADCVPLRSSWLEELFAEWHSGQQLILGAWIGSKSNPMNSHINGNLIFSPRITRAVPALLQPTTPVMAWDVHFWKNWRHLSKASKLIYSDYHVEFKKCDQLWEPRGYDTKDNPLFGHSLSPCWLHGIKSVKALECVRERLVKKDL